LFACWHGRTPSTLVAAAGVAVEVEDVAAEAAGDHLWEALAVAAEDPRRRVLRRRDQHQDQRPVLR